MDTGDQQENRRMGYPLPGAVRRSGANRHESVDAAVAVENFTIAFDKTAGGCTLRMDWETNARIRGHLQDVTGLRFRESKKGASWIQRRRLLVFVPLEKAPKL